MKNVEFRTASSVQGGLIVMAGVTGVAAGSRVQLKDHAGRLRNGLVIRSADDAVLVEVFEGTDDLDLERTWVRFLDEPFKLPVSRDILGRVFNGAGLPRDGRPPIISADRRDVNGEPLNPAARAYPREFIQTGISAIDGMNSLTRGQKLPVFSGGGLPHNRVAAQIVRQAKLLGEESSEFVVVFAAFGASNADARFFQESFEESGVLNKVVMFLNLADEPVIERLLTPRAALTAAEYLAYDLRGSITMIPVLSMPSDDITHPIPDLTGYITEGQIVLGRELANQGVYRRHHRRRGIVRRRPPLPAVRRGLRAPLHRPGRRRGPQRLRDPQPGLGPTLHVATGGPDPGLGGRAGQVPQVAGDGGSGMRRGKGKGKREMSKPGSRGASHVSRFPFPVSRTQP